VRFPRRTQRYKLIRGCVRRRAFVRAEHALVLYRYLLCNRCVAWRAQAWSQEALCMSHTPFKCLILQNLCVNSGRKRAVLRFFQMHRLEVRAALVGLQLPGMVCYY
jgi:ribosomal protein S14